MLLILQIRLIELKTRFSSTKNRKLLSLMQVSILENGQRIVKRFKILLIINLRRAKFRKVLIEMFLVSFGIFRHNFTFDFTDIIGLCITLEPTKRNISKNSRNVLRPTWINFTYYVTNQNYIAKTI